jgi:hypothetical protein
MNNRINENKNRLKKEIQTKKKYNIIKTCKFGFQFIILEHINIHIF